MRLAWRAQAHAAEGTIGKAVAQAVQADGLRVLERPEIPLHTNASENDLHACVIKRKISGGAMSCCAC